ncbi:hypothetical protein FOZ61_004140, partial [Perkinsus olseni]
AFTTLQKSTQNFVRDPSEITQFGYRQSMKEIGTELHFSGKFREVTEDMKRICDFNLESRCFLFPSLDFGSLSKGNIFSKSRRERYLKAVCGDVSDVENMLNGDPTLSDVKRALFCYNLVSVPQKIGKETRATGDSTGLVNEEGTYWLTCNCKMGRDWGVCPHCFACEIFLKQQKP